MFGKKNKVEMETTKKVVMNNNTPSNSNVIGRGIYTVKDFVAPASFERTSKYHIQVGDKFARSFVMTGFPSVAQVGWLDELYHYDGDMDTALYIEPADERTALDELTNKITQFEAQFALENNKGNIRNVTKLRATIEELYAQRARLEQNYENLFYIQIVSTLYSDTEENLKMETTKIDNKMKGRKIYLMPLFLRQDEGYKSSLPLGKSYLPEHFRNFNSAALTTCFPFYNSEITHKTGVFAGINLDTMTPILIDFYDRSLLNNSNITVFGQAGSGKTFFVSLLTMRSALKGVRTVIIDPEGEYLGLTDLLDGRHIYISPDSEMNINPFDLEEEYDTDTNEWKVGIKQKASDVLNLIAVMVKDLSNEEASIVSACILELYRDFGFNENPQSLYKNESEFDEETGTFIQGNRLKKDMPTLSNLHKVLGDYMELTQDFTIKRVVTTLKMFLHDGIYGMFDRQTSPSLRNFKDSILVTFDISQLEESILRPIGMYIALSWTWEKFVKKNPHIKKRVIADEAWMLVNQNMEGHQYTSKFLEQCSRRIRKRNGGLLVASQNFIEFYHSTEGKAVLTNAVSKIFLKQSSTDIDKLQEVFKLSDGEKNFLLTADRGTMLMKLDEDTSVAYAFPFKFEQELISTSMIKRNELLKRQKEKNDLLTEQLEKEERLLRMQEPNQPSRNVDWL